MPEPKDSRLGALERDGFLLLPAWVPPLKLSPLEAEIARAHQAWLEAHPEAYRQGAINSAYLTRPGDFPASLRARLFAWIGSSRVAELVGELFERSPRFLNTQLFFDPWDPSQANYWHRDIQYTGLSLREQKERLATPRVLHLRLALRTDPGIDFVPGSHARWDSETEAQIRLEAKGQDPEARLTSFRTLALSPGDLLVFFANGIHRGNYGQDRLSLDLIFTDPDPEVLKFADPSCFPSPRERAALEAPEVFGPLGSGKERA